MSPYHKNLNLKRSPWIRIVSKDIAVQSSEKSEWDGGGNRWGVVGKMGRESSRTSEGRPDNSERNRGRVANCSFATTFFKSIPISLRNVARRRRNRRMEKREMEMDREHAYITLSLSFSLLIYLSVPLPLLAKRHRFRVKRACSLWIIVDNCFYKVRLRCRVRKE